MATDFHNVYGLLCEKGHCLWSESRVRDGGASDKTNVPLDVAIDLRDHPFPCDDCCRKEVLDACGGDWKARDAYEPKNLTMYRLRFVGEPHAVCGSCGKPSSCGCNMVVAVEAEVVSVPTAKDGQ